MRTRYQFKRVEDEYTEEKVVIAPDENYVRIGYGTSIGESVTIPWDLVPAVAATLATLKRPESD